MRTRLLRDPAFLMGYGIFAFSAICQLAGQFVGMKREMCGGPLTHSFHLPWWWFTAVGVVVLLRVLVLWRQTRSQAAVSRVEALARR